MRKGMNYSEAGRLGGIAARQYGNALRRGNIERYNENPKLCRQCETPIPYDKRRNGFCGHSCAATYNNVGVNRHVNSPIRIVEKGGGKKEKRRVLLCQSCGNPLNRKQSKYCSQHCQKTYEWDRKKEEFEQNGIKDTQRATGRKYLVEVRGHRCEICGITEWQGKPVPLILDHIDGNAENGDLDNFRLVCPNCDAQLPTYKGANKGNGRKSRRK